MTQSGHCNESVPARRSEPFAGPFGRLPDGRVWILGADDGEEFITLPRLPGGLALFDLSKAGIVIQYFQVSLIQRDEEAFRRRLAN